MRSECAIAKKTAGPPPRRNVKPTAIEKVPRVIAQPSLDDHLAVVSRAIFQAGLSWAFIELRWPAFLAAFDGFEVARVAAYDDLDVDRIMATDHVVHSRAKIAGTIRNAQALQSIVAEFGSVERYARSFTDYDALYADAKKRFAYLGDLSCYYWLFRAGLPVPHFDRWLARQERDHPRMREMVEQARREGVSSETP